MATTEEVKYYQVINHLVGKDICESIVVGHVFAKHDRDVFRHIQNMYKPWSLREEGEESEEEDDYGCPFQEEADIIESRGDDINDIEIGEFYGSGYAWEEKGVIASEDRVVLKKWLNAEDIN
jgi:predicted nucleotide-binding protein (sugar kinase/HSP70/actin superfamily)